MSILSNWKKSLKIAAWAAGTFVVIVAIAVLIASIVIPKKYPPEKIKQMITEQLSAKINRKIVLKDAQFNLFSGFRLTGLSVSNRAGWTNKPFLAADDISIGYRLFPLLWLQLELGEIKLEKPVILIEKKGPTEYNFSDLMGGASAAATTSAATASTSSTSNAAVSRALALFSVAQVTIHQGQITYIDYMSKPTMEVQIPGADLTIKNISLSGSKTTFDLKAPIVFGGTTYAFNAKGSERFNWSNQTLTGLKVEGEFQGIQFSLSGDATKVVDDFSPKMSGEATLDLTKVAALMPKSMGALPKDLSMTGTFTFPFTVGGSLKQGLNFEGSADLTSADLAFGNAFKKAKGVTTKADFKAVIGTDYYKVSSFNATLAGWNVKGSAAMTGLEAYPGDPKANPAFAVSISAPSLPMKELTTLSPMLKDFALTGEVGVDIACSGSTKKPANGLLRGGIDFKGLNVTGPKNLAILGDMTGRMTMTDTSIDLPSMKFKLMGTPASCDFKMSRFHAAELADFAKCNALIAFNFDASDIDLEKIMTSMGVTMGGPKTATTQTVVVKSTPMDLRNVVSSGLQVSGRMTVKSFFYRKLKLENATASMTLVKKQFKTVASVAGFSGKASASMTADLNQAPLSYGYDLSLLGVSAQSAINDGVDSFVTKNPENYKDKVTGTMDFKFAGSGLMDAEPAKSLKGNGTFKIASASVQGLAMLGGMMDSLKDSPKAVKMDTLDGTLVVADSKVSVTANSSGEFGKVRLNGAVGFDGNYAPEMRVETDIKKEMLDSKKVFGFLPSSLQSRVDVNRAADAQGFIPVDFKFTGAVSSAPGLKALDPTRLTKNVTSSYTKAITNKVTSTVTDKLGDKTGKSTEAVGNALKGLFKH
jgi:hypothetical protein